MLLSARVLYRFDEFELDASARVLTRNGAPVPVKPKDLDVLTYLVLNTGRVVTKAELIQAVWPDAFVEENNLNQHISALRKALSDKSAWIVTFSGRGYQFTAPVQLEHPVNTLPERLQGDVFVQRVRERTHVVIENATPALAPLALASAPKSGRRFALWWAVASVLAGALIAPAAFYLRRHFSNPPRLSEVVVADFTNNTGDATFDQTLDRALGIGLEQSPFLNLLSKPKVEETLALMKRNAGERLTPELAGEICERNDAQAVLHGSIANIGSKYLLTLAADSCVNGKRVAGAKAEADSKEEVLSALDKVAGRVRSQLGESAASLNKFQTPIAQATTRSLEALRAYSQALDSSDRGDFTSAQALFEHAIALDTRFASAYRGLSDVYYSRLDFIQAASFIQKAYDLRADTTERERLTIEITYNKFGSWDVEAAIDSMNLYNQVYPNDAANWFGLCNMYSALGQYPLAIEAGEHAYRLAPHSGTGAEILARVYRRASRFADAKRVAAAAIADGKDLWGIHSTLFQIAFAEHDAAGMKTEAEWGFTHRQLAQSLINVGFAAASEGKLKEAIDDFSSARREAIGSGETDFADDTSMALAAILFEFGDPSGASACLRQMKSDGGDPGTVAFFKAELGDPAPAQRLIAKITGSGTRNTLSLYFDLPMLRALLALKANKPNKAVEEIAPARKYQMRDYGVPYQRARIEAAAGMLEQAAEDYRLILANQGIDPVWPDFTLSHLRLARVLALQNNKAGSRSEYEKFFDAWKAADANVPILKKAHTEYSHLK